MSKKPDGLYIFRLFVAGSTPNSAAAIVNLRKFCEDNLAGRYRLSVCDLLTEPQSAQAEQIVATPTLIRDRPRPPRRFIGDVSSPARILVGDDLIRYLEKKSVVFSRRE